MGLPLAIFAAGQLINTIGKFSADAAQADAERRNAAYYQEQEKFNLEEMFREVSIFDRKSSILKGQQMASAGGRGIAITHFTLDTLSAENARMSAERAAIVRQGEFKARLAGLRAHQSYDTADALGSPERALGNLSGLLTSAASVYISQGKG